MRRVFGAIPWCTLRPRAWRSRSRILSLGWRSRQRQASRAKQNFFLFCVTWFAFPFLSLLSSSFFLFSFFTAFLIHSCPFLIHLFLTS